MIDTYTDNTEVNRARIEILNALKNESQRNSWIHLCELIYKNLPFLKSGKPTKEAIKLSIVGRLGFKSLKEFIEAPIDEKGLGWSENTWKTTKRMYNLHLKYSYIKELNVSVTQLSRIQTTLKSNGFDFPETLEEYQDILQKIEQKKIAKKSESSANIKKEKNNLEEENKKLREMNEKLLIETIKLKDENSAALSEIQEYKNNELARELKNNEKLLDQQRNYQILQNELIALQNKVREKKELSWSAGLKRVFGVKVKI